MKTTAAVVQVIRTRSAAQRLTTAEFIAYELDMDIRAVRAAIDDARVTYQTPIKVRRVGDDNCFSV